MLTEYARRASRSDASFYGGAISVTEEAKRKLLTPEFRGSAQGTGRIADRYFRQIGEITSNGNDQLRKMIYFEFKSRLAELLLMRVDKMSMATSIEARVPFLDHRLVEFSMQIPSALKVKDGIPKYILKKAAEGIIPHNIIYRKKQGFAAPVSEWLRNGRLSGFAYERILESKIMGEEIFNRKRIEFLFEQHRSGKRNFSLQLWTLLVVAMWYDTYIA
jgi:asparagine synthase (glutamine-hydrolysing)